MPRAVPVASDAVAVCPGEVWEISAEQVWSPSVHVWVAAGQAEPQPEVCFCQVPSKQR